MHPFDCAAESQTVHEGASQPSISQGSLSQKSEAGAAMICDRILDGRVDFGYAPWTTMSDGENRYYFSPLIHVLNIIIAKNLIRKLLVHEPKSRCSADDAIVHQWIQKDIKRLEELYEAVTK